MESYWLPNLIARITVLRAALALLATNPSNICFAYLLIIPIILAIIQIIIITNVLKNNHAPFGCIIISSDGALQNRCLYSFSGVQMTLGGGRSAKIIGKKHATCKNHNSNQGDEWRRTRTIGPIKLLWLHINITDRLLIRWVMVADQQVRRFAYVLSGHSICFNCPMKRQDTEDIWTRRVEVCSMIKIYILSHSTQAAASCLFFICWKTLKIL